MNTPDHEKTEAGQAKSISPQTDRASQETTKTIAELTQEVIDRINAQGCAVFNGWGAGSAKPPKAPGFGQ